MADYDFPPLPYTHTWHIPRCTSDTLQSTAPSSFPFEICKTTRAKLGDKKHRERFRLSDLVLSEFPIQ